MVSIQDLLSDVKISPPAPSHTTAPAVVALGAGAGAARRVAWGPSAAT